MPALHPIRDSGPHTVEISKSGSNFTNIWDTLSSSATDATAKTGTYITFFNQNLNDYVHFNWVFLAKYVYPEPAHGAWAFEEPVEFT